MKTPMPVDELPSFLLKNNQTTEPGSNPWLKFIIVGGILLLGVAVSASIMRTKRQDNIKLKSDENENREN
ncbi:hypothetical protein N9651_01320 [Flavobacteriales bacterium]|jgi:hypothetical protein|nr:hypothetical protein [Flavobacteriales bacterium]